MQVTSPSFLSRITLWVSLGSLVEYYDFVVYAMMAKYLALLFFPSQHETLAVLQSFLVFAVGYFVRPFGGALIGIMGDRFGRKPAFLMLTGLISFSTLAIGFLPTFESCGLFAPLLLILCRILQGISYAGELPGAITIIKECIPFKFLGSYTSFVISSTSIGALLATAILYGLTTFFEDPQILSFAWRLPFIIGGILGFILFGFRYTLIETPAFKESPALKNPLIFLFKGHLKEVLQGMSLTVFFAALIILNIFFPYYIPTYFGFSSQDVYFGITVSLIFSALILPFCGKISDYYSKKHVLLKTTAFYCFFSVGFFSLLLSHQRFCLFLFLINHQFFIALFGASYFPTMTNLFPTTVRYTGVAFCYNITFALLALLPTLLTPLIQITSPWSVPFCISLLSLISLGGVLTLPLNAKEKRLAL